ncbi:MAG: hypothetical protein GY810_16810 [Aureispira sp.]|nr:hypothetical protein [Aureispira sp.]
MKSFFILLMFALSTALIGTSCNSSNADSGNAALSANARAGDNEEAQPNTDEPKITESTNTEPYTSEEGNFSILFPGTPEKTTETTPTEVGPIDITMYLYEAGPTLAYLVGYSDYPEEIIKNGDVNEMLKGAQEGVVGNIQGEIVEDKNILLDDKHSGKYFTAKSTQFNVVYELYLVNNRLYQVGVMSTQSLDNDPVAKEFVGSFKLLSSGNDGGEESQ